MPLSAIGSDSKPGRQKMVSVGSSASCDFRLEGSNVLEQHALLETRGKRMFCRAALQDEDDFLRDTFTWLDGNPLRQGGTYFESVDRAMRTCLHEKVKWKSTSWCTLKLHYHEFCCSQAAYLTGNRVGCALEIRSLVSNPSDIFVDVAYSAQSGAQLAFGEADNIYRLEYDQGSQQRDPLMDMMIKGWAASASQDVKDRLNL